MSTIEQDTDRMTRIRSMIQRAKERARNHPNSTAEQYIEDELVINFRRFVEEECQAVVEYYEAEMRNKAAANPERGAAMSDNEYNLLTQRLRARLENSFGTQFMKDNVNSIPEFCRGVMRVISDVHGSERTQPTVTGAAGHAHHPDRGAIMQQAQSDTAKAVRKEYGPADRHAIYANMLITAGVKHMSADLFHALDRMVALTKDWQ